MADQYRATDLQWDRIKARTSDNVTYSTILELRDRIEALEREAAMNELRAASAEARPTVKARITRDRDETGDYLIIHDASPNHPAKPDGSLVERVAAAITGDSDEPINWKPEARAAIREVAAWLRENPDVYFAPALVFVLEKEAEHRST